jgi:hypothetical protein
MNTGWLEEWANGMIGGWLVGASALSDGVYSQLGRKREGNKKKTSEKKRSL